MFGSLIAGKDWLSGGRTVSTPLDRLEACGCSVMLDKPRQALQ